MKKIIMLPFSAFCLFASYSNNNAGKVFTNKKSSAITGNEKNENISLPADGIISDWKLSVETYDENQNKKLDPQERAKAFSNHFFFRFNADGTGLVNFNNTVQGAFKAHYKISTRKNLQFLSVFIDEDKTENPDGLNGGYYIISVDKNELILLGGLDERAFWILKRS